MKRPILALDMEFRDNPESKKYDVICACTQTEAESKQFWLLDEENTFANSMAIDEFATYMEDKVKEGYIISAHFAHAETTALLSLGLDIDHWDFIDTWAEAKLLQNSDNKSKRKMLSLADLTKATKIFNYFENNYKDEMRKLILTNTSYTEEQKYAILTYCSIDAKSSYELTFEIVKGFEKVYKVPYNWDDAITRGNYNKAAAHMSWVGIPINTDYLEDIKNNYRRVVKDFIDASHEDVKACYIEKGLFFTFKYEVFASMVDKHNLGENWKLSEKTGKYSTEGAVLKDMRNLHPFIESLYKTQKSIQSLKYLKPDETMLRLKELKTLDNPELTSLLLLPELFNNKAQITKTKVLEYVESKGLEWDSYTESGKPSITLDSLTLFCYQNELEDLLKDLTTVEAYKLLVKYNEESNESDDDSEEKAKGLYDVVKQGKIHIPFGAMGTAEPLTNVIRTPFGNTTIGELSKGDIIFDDQGKPTKVVELYDKGVRPCYTLVFDDGSEVTCCEDHLWEVTDLRTSKSRIGKHVYSVKEMISLPYQKEGESSFAVDLCKPLKYPKQLIVNEFDPYVLGAILGNGNVSARSGVRFHHHEDYMQECLSYFKPEYITGEARNDTLTKGGVKHISKGQTVSIAGTKKYLINLNLIGENSLTKFIPDSYLYSTVADRIALLQGLMDTDGGYDSSCKSRVYYSTSSERLRDDILTLLKGLGLKPRVQEVSPQSRWNQKIGKQLVTRGVSYRIVFSVPSYLGFSPFRLTLKNANWEPNDNLRSSRRYINRIIKAEDQAVRCIEVSNQSHLYLTSLNNIVTHNCTSRNAPKARFFVFAQSAWQRSLIQVPKGFKLVSLDYVSEENYVAAIWGKDRNMLEAYFSKDFYLYIGIHMGLVNSTDFNTMTAEELKEKYSKERKMLKTLCFSGDTKVITDKGVKLLENVTKDDKVFNGLTFVKHCGVISKGVQEVIQREGLVGTSGHEIYVNKIEKEELCKVDMKQARSCGDGELLKIKVLSLLANALAVVK